MAADASSAFVCAGVCLMLAAAGNKSVFCIFLVIVLYVHLSLL